MLGQWWHRKFLLGSQCIKFHLMDHDVVDKTLQGRMRLVELLRHSAVVEGCYLMLRVLVLIKYKTVG